MRSVLLICLLVSCGSPARAVVVSSSQSTPATVSPVWIPAPGPCVLRGERPAATRSTGTIHGVVCERGTGEPAIGATVVATSSSLVGEQVVITDEGGVFVLTGLPPGEYTLTYYYDNAVTSGRATVFAAEITTVTGQLERGRDEVIQIRGRVPTVSS